MKRWIALLLLAALLPAWVPGGAAAEETPRPREENESGASASRDALYEAYIQKETPLRKTPGGGQIGKLKEYTLVDVLELGEKWALVDSGRRSGWVAAKSLVRFRSLDPMKYKVPGATVNAGAATLEKPVRIKGGDFGGLQAQAETVVCVTAADEKEYRLAVYRGEGTISRDSGGYQPFVSWEEAQPGDLIGGFTTYYNSKTGAPKAKERQDNIALACSRISETEIKAGRRFSFNELCAPYTRENQYVLAPNVSAKGLGYGGGVCQVSTTLYNALLGLPLLVESFTVHSKAGVPYVPKWFDAAVSSLSDLTFSNTLPYPIRLWAAPQGGALTVLIYRAGNLWPEITED